MKKYYYDLHIHSCLSPCGDNVSTPNSIAGMGKINGLDIMALCDHNTCKNCPAFFEAAERYGILPIAGMELTTAEDIHMVCLFPTLNKALEFEAFIKDKRVLIPNRADIFGEQLVCDSEDNIIGNDEYLLINAVNISVEDAPRLVDNFGGICYPAHIDKEANGMIAILGTVPEDLNFSCVELHNRSKAEEYTKRYGLENKKLLFNSDAHYLYDIKERLDFLLLEEITDNKKAGKTVIEYLRNGL